MVNRLVMFFSTVAIGTPRCLSAKKDVQIMPTKITLTGNQSRAIAKLHGSSFTAPATEQPRTSTTQTRHWKSSSEIGDVNAKLLSVALLSRTIEAEAARAGAARASAAARAGAGAGWGTRSPRLAGLPVTQALLLKASG